MHGHLHYFEAISFKTSHPASFVMGNSASANEEVVATSLPADFQPYPSALVDDYAARAEYGFATLDRVKTSGSSQWLLTKYSAKGQAVLRCDIRSGKSKCLSVSD